MAQVLKLVFDDSYAIKKPKRERHDEKQNEENQLGVVEARQSAVSATTKQNYKGEEEQKELESNAD